jgi:hypothetical protein
MDRSHVAGILNKRLNEYMLEAEDDLRLDENNLRDKSLLRSSYAAKWLRYGYEENAYKKTLLNQIDLLKEQIKQDLYQQKKNGIINQNAALDKLITIDAERELMNNATYKKLKKAVEIQEDIIRLIYEVQKIISAFGYDISNSKSVIQLEQI